MNCAAVLRTEPDCGTDLQNPDASRSQGDHYVVNGAKTWISNSIMGHVLAVLVKPTPTRNLDIAG